MFDIAEETICTVAHRLNETIKKFQVLIDNPLVPDDLRQELTGLVGELETTLQQLRNRHGASDL